MQSKKEMQSLLSAAEDFQRMKIAHDQSNIHGFSPPRGNFIHFPTSSSSNALGPDQNGYDQYNGQDNFGQEYYGGEDDEEEDGEEDDYYETEAMDKAPEMSAEYYQQIDSFLSRPPPKFDDFATTSDDVGGKKKKKAKKNGEEKSSKGSASSGIFFPPINKKFNSGYANSIDSDQENDPMKGMGGGTDTEDEVPSKAMKKSGKPKKSMHVTNTVNSRVYEQMNFNTMGKGSNRQIDTSLLKEAFAYTDLLLKEAVIEEVESTYMFPPNHPAAIAAAQAQQQGNNKGGNQQMNSHGSKKLMSADDGLIAAGIAGISNAYAEQQHPRSAPNNDHHAGNGGGGSGKKKKKSSGSINAIRQLKSNKAAAANNPSATSSSNPNPNDFVTGNDSVNLDYKRNPVNFDELVANFQYGITLEKLKQELAQSQQSLQHSESFIKELSGHYISKKGSNKSKK
jgi:hypothetical protein